MGGKKEMPVGWEMGSRIMVHTYGCQGLSSIDLIEAPVRRVIVSRADTPEGDTHTTKKKMPNGKIVPF